MAMKKEELKNVPIDALTPYANNPRDNLEAVHAVKRSLERYGLVKNSVVVDENNVLITGHTTLAAMQKLGWKTIPEVTKVTGLSEGQKKAYRLEDNKTGEVAKWNKEKLANELEMLDKQFQIDVKELGFSEAETQQVLTEASDTDFMLEDVPVPDEDPAVWFVIRGTMSNYDEIKDAIVDFQDNCEGTVKVVDSNGGEY
jgi:ParB-like chromosome segregation protein Spo0J